ncbi:hypothetical protein ACPA5B_26470 [Pseudomonas solani]|uniref:hypothetical protein n=1 Tax=Pseudomonas solani TaxID=2731552 RepID=UPI003C2ADE9C
MNAIINTIASWLGAIARFFLRIFEWLKGLFLDVMEFFLDLPLVVFKGVIEGALYLLTAIPVPDFLASYSLGAMFAALPAALQFFVGAFNLHLVFLIISAGVAFRLLRKVLTLGQW